MLKLLLHIALITALLTQQLQMVVVCAVFKAQQSYLSKNVCVNRDNPNSKCSAHCQLVKRMNEKEKQESENKIPLKEEIEFIEQFEKPSLKIFRLCIPKINYKKQADETLSSGFHCQPFQPPEGKTVFTV